MFFVVAQDRESVSEICVCQREGERRMEIDKGEI